VADAAAEDLGRPPTVRAVVGGEVHRRVEGAAGEEALEVGRRAVAPQALQAGAEGVGERPPVEEGDRVPAGEEPPGELVAQEARPADDEDPQGSLRRR
jgi:hypothetical protein